ncbi:MAG: SPASM domain-containing protein [Bacteroidales bacterium]|nr:SPASM domain-containing protein [Bacteroidales bacterium]
MKKYGVICSDPEEQRKAIIDLDKKRSNVKSKSLSITILPTFLCNCRCEYCFEPREKKNGSNVISNKLAAKIVEFVKKSITEQGIKSLKVIWYGGEPLICIDKIIVIQKELNDICLLHNVKCENSMVTNGLLLTKTNIEKLLNVKINQVQITFDGSEKIHNQRRYFPSNPEDNYNILVNNIKESDENLTFNIRINVDSNNLENIHQLIKDLENKGIWPYKKNIKSIYLGDLIQGRDSTGIAFLSREQFLLIQEEFRQWLVMEYNSIFPDKPAKLAFRYPSQTKDYACAYGNINSNSWIIDHMGNLYRCWEAVGYDDLTIGTIDDLLNNSDSKFEDKLSSFTNLEAKREKANCSTCKYLPICGTGCPFEFIIENVPQERFCTEWKYILEKRLLFQYNFKRKHPEWVK